MGTLKAVPRVDTATPPFGPEEPPACADRAAGYYASRRRPLLGGKASCLPGREALPCQTPPHPYFMFLSELPYRPDRNYRYQSFLHSPTHLCSKYSLRPYLSQALGGHAGDTKELTWSPPGGTPGDTLTNFCMRGCGAAQPGARLGARHDSGPQGDSVKPEGRSWDSMLRRDKEVRRCLGEPCFLAQGSTPAVGNPDDGTNSAAWGAGGLSPGICPSHKLQDGL